MIEEHGDNRRMGPRDCNEVRYGVTVGDWRRGSM